MAVTRRLLIRTGLSGSAALLAAPYVARNGFAATPLHNLKMTYPDTATHPMMQIGRRFADNVRKKTDGAVDIQVYAIGQLGSGINILTGMQTGIIDLCAHTSGFVETLYPKFQVMDLPFLFEDAGAAERVLDGPTGRTLLEGLPAKGIYGLSFGHWGWRVVSTVDRAVPTPDKMRGLKIRVQPGAIFAAMFRALDASPIAIDLTEVYLALSQRAIEAIETPIVALPPSKHDEVVKKVNLTNHVYNAGVMMASKRKFDTLAPEHQKAIRDAAIEMTPDWRQTIAKATDDVTVQIKAKGLEVLPVDRKAYRAATDRVYKDFRDIIGADLMDSVVKQATKA